MFDAKSLLEALMKGAGPGAGPQAAAPQAGGLGDILGQLMPKGPGAAAAPAGGGGLGGLGDILGQLAQAAGGAGQNAGRAAAAPAGGGLEDILRNLLPGAGGGQPAPASHAAPASGGGLGGLGDILGKLGGPGAAGGAGGLGDILGKLQTQAGVGGGSLMDVLGKVLGQATEGVREGAGRIGDATGAREAVGKATGGASADDVLAKLKELINQNQLGAGAAMGGLGALVLGTHTGRSLAASAAKLGALALIGGLAYKALQNYQSGRPLITGASALDAPPAGSGFEAQAVTQETAALYIRAMIAAAAADGRIDDAEQAKIIGSVSQSGHLSEEARAFLQNEVNNPASPAQLAAEVQSPEQAVQVYSAARFAIEPDDRNESRFLAELASALGIDADLAAHIEATARSATAAA